MAATITASTRTATCAGCRREFVAPGRRGRLPRFCSDECRAPRPPQRPCGWCGELMPRTIRSDAKWCSKRCNDAARHAARRRAREPRPCAHCLELMPPERRLNALYCGVGCRRAAEQLRIAAKVGVLTCQACQQRFRTNRGKASKWCPSCRPAQREAAMKVYHREYGKRWREENAEREAERSHRRRARLAAADTRVVTDRDLRRLHGRQRGECCYCHRSGLKLTQEHLIPLARGGRHAIGNLALACGPCNSAKQDLLPVEFKARQLRRLAEAA